MQCSKKNEFPQSWYPVCRSSEIKIGTCKAIDLFGMEWAIFRGQDGKIGIVEKYCSHMGTDLSFGKVEGSFITCPLHNWQFDGKGKCRKSYGTAEPPQEAKLCMLYTVEKYGVIFFFWGKKPLFDFPDFSFIDSPAYSNPTVIPLNNPYLAVGLNTFDQQHYLPVHNRKFKREPEVLSKSPYHLSFHFEATVGINRWSDHIMKLLGYNDVDILIDCWGGNNMLATNINANFGALFSLLPSNDNRTCTLFLAAVGKDHAKNNAHKLWQYLTLLISRQLTKSFVTSDLVIINNMRPKAGVLLPDKDKTAIEFWSYWNKLPRFSGQDL